MMQLRKLRIRKLLLLISISVLVLSGCTRDMSTTSVSTPVVIEALDEPLYWTLIVREDGPYWISPAWFRSQGIANDLVTVEHLALYDGETLVPTYFADSPDGTGLLFLAETVSRRIGPSKGYTLILGKAGVSIPVFSENADGATQRTTRQTLELEQDNQYRSTAPVEVPWFWKALRAPDEMTVALNLPDAVAQPVDITVTFWAQSHMPQDPDHHIRLLWNGDEFDDRKWDAGQGRDTGVISWTVQAPSPDSDAVELTIQSPGETEATVEMTWLDRIEATWTQDLSASSDTWVRWSVDSDFDGAEFDNVDRSSDLVAILSTLDGDVRMTIPNVDDTVIISQLDAETGWLGVPWMASEPYWIRSQARIENDINVVDYLVIANERWHAALAPLIDARTLEGLTTSILTPEQVYDTYGDGTPDSAAINAMVRNLSSEGQLRYVLLVGQASAYPNLVWDEPDITIPTGWVRTNYVGDTSSDVALVADDEGQPLAAIGRLPVSDLETLQTIIGKTIAWEPTSRMAIVNDDEGQFERMSETLVELFEPDVTFNAASDSARTELLAWLRQAPGVLVYTGHGSLPMLGDEKILTIEDVSGWQGPTVVVAWSCLCGTYAHPEHTGLGEAWLEGRDGAVAFVGPTGETTTGEQSLMATTFQQGLVEGERIGDALLNAWTKSVSADTRMSFVLLGDPALRPFPVTE